jgi:hypothetical protein
MTPTVSPHPAAPKLPPRRIIPDLLASSQKLSRCDGMETGAKPQIPFPYEIRCFKFLKGVERLTARGHHDGYALLLPL